MNKKTTMSESEVLFRLIVQNCFAPDGRLGIYPDWLSYEDLQSLVFVGAMRVQSGGPNTYGHTDYYLNIKE